MDEFEAEPEAVPDVDRCHWCGREKPRRAKSWQELELGDRCPKCTRKVLAEEKQAEEEGVESGALLSARVKLKEPDPL